MLHKMADRVDIRAIAFDIGGVLVRYDHAPVWREFARLTRLQDEEVRDLMFQSPLAVAYETGRVDSETFIRRITDALNLRIDPDAFRALWSDIFAPMPGMEELVSPLADRYRLLLASNTNTMHFAWLQARFPVITIPTHPVLSFEVGAMKPDRRFYEALLRHADAPPAACLYIDDVPAYVEAGRDAGLQAVRFEGVDSLRETFRRMQIA